MGIKQMEVRDWGILVTKQGGWVWWGGILYDEIIVYDLVGLVVGMGG
jgi:hypothetical protein